MPLCALYAFSVTSVFSGSALAASAFNTYGDSYRAIALPNTAAPSFGLLGDCLPDGRIVCVTGNNILLESGVATGIFAPVASFDPSQSSGSADPAFVRFSPDGSRIAVGLGSGKPVAIVPISSLGAPGAPTSLTGGLATYFNVAHTEAAWRNNSDLALTAGSFGASSRVTLLDTTSSPTAPTNPIIITNIGGASAGVAFDAAGNLFTGNGFDLGAGAIGDGPSRTGWIKAFSAAQLAAGGGTADFENGGTFIGDILSSASLVFDPEGNLAIGGGDFDPSATDTGYLGLLSSSALADALSGNGPINPLDPDHFKRLAPAGGMFDYYGAAYNPATHDLYATLGDFFTGTNTWYATIPSPAAAPTLALIAILSTRRRRR